jgi:YD repeat-containing protein
MTGSSGTYYYHFDGLGSVVALSNTSGNVVERYEYDVFGQCTVHTGPGNDSI